MTDYIISRCPSRGVIAILGAGRCADIDLQRLGCYFDKILLVDRDESALSEGVHFYNVADRCECVIKDFTGITSQQFARTSEYCSSRVAACIKAGKLKEFKNGLCELIYEIYEENKKYTVDFSDIEADYIVVLGTHSQLNNNFSAQWHVYRQMLQKALGLSADDHDSWIIRGFDGISASVESLQRSATDFIVKRFNDALLSTNCTELILGLETGNTGIMNSQIDGAYNALVDMRKREQGGEILVSDRTSLVWPFDSARGIYYDIEIMKCRRTGM